MSTRLTLNGLAALLLAALASLALTWSAAAQPAAAGQSAAGQRICVGLYLDATAAGGSKTAGCVRVAAGTTGIGVLEAGGHTIQTRDDGQFVCSIDGRPAGGCSGVDATHYWSYWHRPAGGSTWTYSSEGAGAYVPRDGSSDGWVYDDNTNSHPSGVGRLCPNDTRPTPTRSPTATPRPRPSPAQSRPVASSRPSVTPPTPAASHSAHPTATPRTSPTKHRSSNRSSHHHRATKSSASAGPIPQPIAARRTAATVNSGGAPVWQLAVGLGAVVLVGVAAWWRNRRISR